jgi:TPR repeat protein
MYLIASMYEQGDGVTRDLEAARHWYAQAAGLGDRLAAAKVVQLEAALEAL